MNQPGPRRSIAVSLQDAVALAGAWGAGTRVVLGSAAGSAEIMAPAGPGLTAQETDHALRNGAGRILVTFGNEAAAPEAGRLAPVLNQVIEQSGIGFMTACLAAPALGRTVYQGHLFQDGKLVGNLQQMFSKVLEGRVVVIPHDLVTAGGAVLRRQIAAHREQGAALALLDALDPAECDGVAAALESQLLVGGPAWLGGTMPPKTEPAPPAGPVAILCGALDRQTLFQLGAARGTTPLLQLDFSAAEVAGPALAWAADYAGQDYILAASAAPDRLTANTTVTAIMAEIAQGLASAGVRRFVLAGHDTAAAILHRLGVTSLVVGAETAGLRWLHGEGYNFLLKPGGFGARNLFLDGFEPHMRLNAAAE